MCFSHRNKKGPEKCERNYKSDGKENQKKRKEKRWRQTIKGIMKEGRKEGKPCLYKEETILSTYVPLTEKEVEEEEQHSREFNLYICTT